MIPTDGGVLAGWRGLWPSLTVQWREYLVYSVLAFVLSILGGVSIGLLTVPGAIGLLLVFGLFFALGAALFVFGFPPLGLAVLVVLGIGNAVPVLAVLALVQLPVKTYLRYYALLVLGHVEPTVDLMAEQRARVGEQSGDGAA